MQILERSREREHRGEQLFRRVASAQFQQELSELTLQRTQVNVWCWRDVRTVWAER